MSVDVLGINCVSMVQCCFTSTETIRLFKNSELCYFCTGCNKCVGGGGGRGVLEIQYCDYIIITLEVLLDTFLLIL